jgi:hypothetical protein
MRLLVRARRASARWLVRATLSVLAVWGMRAAAVERPIDARQHVWAAIGGERAIGAVTSLSAYGHFQRAVENDARGAGGDIELHLTIPDKKYLKKQSYRDLEKHLYDVAWSTDGVRAWFRHASGGVSAVGLKQLQRERERLLLALFAIGPESGTGELQAGAAGDMTVVAADGSVAMRLLLDERTHLPAGLRYEGTLFRMWRDAQRPDPMETALRGGPKQRSEIEVRLSDHRPESGLALPHRLTFYSAGKLAEEWVIERFDVNGPIDARVFMPR